MKYLLSIVLFISGSLVFAQEQEVASNGLSHHTLYFSLGRASFEKEAAQAQGVDEGATSIELAWEGEFTNKLILGVGLSGYFYSDNESFSQLTKDGYGDVSNSESSASGWGAFGEIGYGYGLNETVSLDLLAGFDLMMSSSRDIGYCTDCYSEDIDLSGGAYISPRIRFKSESWMFAFTYQSFMNGDIENNLNATLGFMY